MGPGERGVTALALTLSTAVSAQALTGFDGGAAADPEATALTTVVTGTKSQRRLSDSPVATEVITRKEVLESGAKDVSEALQARAGLEVFPNLGGTQLRMQGLGPEYNLLIVDGQRAAGRVNGAIDLSRYSVEDLQQLEIVKGPSSVVWGSDALAGVVHLVTRRATRPFGLGALASFGVLNQVDARLSSEVTRGDWAARGSFVFGQRDAYDLDPSTTQTSGSSFRSFQGSVRGTYGDFGGAGVFADVRAAALSRVQRGVDANDNGAVFDRAAGDVLGEGSAHVSLPLGPGRLGLTAGLNLWSRRFVLDQRGSSALDQVQDSTDRNAQLTATYQVVLGRHEAQAGLEGLGEQFSSPRIVGGLRTRGRLSLFVQDTWAPALSRRLVVVPGVRVDLDSLFGVVVTPRLAVRFDPVPTLALRASVGTGFRAPSFQELYLDFENPGAGYRIDGNPALGPERSVGATLAAEWQPAPTVSVAGSVFWNELRDMIGYSSSTADLGLRFSYANIAQARSRGAEAMAQWAVAPWLSLGLGGTVTDARDLTADKPLENQATWRGVSQLRVRWRWAGVVALVRASVTGPRPLSDGESSTLYTQPFALVDARVAKTVLDWFEVFLSAQNLVGAGNPRDLPIAPRLVFGGLSFTY